jgi:ribonuclease P protein component
MTQAKVHSPDRRLRPTERVQRPLEFQRVMKGGRCFRDPLLRIHFIENGRELSRLGLVVSRKMGNAVARNRLKRIFRASFREVKSLLPAPLDLVVVPSPQAGRRESADYRQAFERFAGWAGLRPPSRSPAGRSR